MKIQVETRGQAIWRRFYCEGVLPKLNYWTPWRQIGLVGEVMQVGVDHCRFVVTKEDLSMGILEEINAKLDKLLAMQGGTAVAAAIEDADDPETGEEEAPAPKKAGPGRPKGSTSTSTETKKNSKVATLAQVKDKLKELLAAKGRDPAVAVLEEFGAAKLADLEEKDYVAFIASADKAMASKPKKPAADEDDLGLDEDEE